MHARDTGKTPDDAARTPDRALPTAPEAVRTAPGTTSARSLLALQRTAGNAATVRSVQRAQQSQEEERHRHGPGCGHGPVQRSAVPGVLSSGGTSLDEPVRHEMEARLGADFSDVRLHTDGAARASAAEIGARAYTSGNHVVIGDGGADKHTLAHELTHVIQQRQGPVAGTDNGSGLQVSDPADHFEREAEANARQVMSGNPALVTDNSGGGRATADVQPSLQRVEQKQQKKLSPQAEANQQFAADVQQQLKARGWKVDGSPAVWARMTAHKVTGVDPDKVKSGNQAYKESPKNVIKPRSYRNEPEKQAMRWISSIAMKHLDTRGTPPVEIQSAIHAGALHIAANSAAANTALQDRTRGKTGKAFLSDLIADNPADLERLEEFTGRVDRHTVKADKRLGDQPVPKGDGPREPNRYAQVIKALAKPVVVAADGPDGYHAERRISELAGETPQYIAGTKRPCVSCYMKLFTGSPGVRPGPFWMSGAANQKVEEYGRKDVTALVDQLESAVDDTYATLKWQCVEKCDGEEQEGRPSKRAKKELGVTVDHGSDSETDTEGRVRTYRQ